MLLSCFLGVLAAALLAFRFRSEQYLTPLFPVIVLIAVITSPVLRRWFALPVLAALFLIKAANPERPWGISYQSGSTVAAAETLSNYCKEHRGNDLYVLDVDDEFYSLALPLGRLHYGWIDPNGTIERLHPHLGYLGIVQSTQNTIEQAEYASRLRAWGIDISDALRTSIAARSSEELASLVLAQPESDFVVSPEIARLLAGRQSQAVAVTKPSFVLLQSGTPARASPARWTCNM